MSSFLGNLVGMRNVSIGSRARAISIVTGLLPILSWSNVVGLAEETTPAPAASSRPTERTKETSPKKLSVEERLEKLEAMNQRLLEQNQKLTEQLQAITHQIQTTPAKAPNDAMTTPAAAAMQPVPVIPPNPDPDVIRTEPLTGAAAGGGTLIAPPTGSEPGPVLPPGADVDVMRQEPSTGAAAGGGTLIAPSTGIEPGPALPPGTDVDVIRREPSTGAAAGGGDLISFDPKDTKDAKGIEMVGRFGRRFTNNGLWFESPNKNFQVHLGGRTQMDTAFFSTNNAVQYGPNGIGKLRDGSDVRRFRFRMEGAMYENMLYVMEVDFVNSSISQGTPGSGPLTSVVNTPAASIPVPLDLWVGFRKIPYIGNIRIGNQKEPFGFERITSSRYLNFMERSFNQDAFYGPFDNGFVPGVQTFNTLDNLKTTYAFGIFKNQTNPFGFDVGGGNYKVTGRFTHLLLYEDGGKEMMHFGISARQSGYDNGKQRFRVRGPERGGAPSIWPQYAATPVFNGSGGQQDINIELANVFGPWTIDAEYNFHFSHDAFLPGKPSVGTVFYSGGYVEALYFLTGEHRTYVRESGVYDRIVPRRNAYWVKGEDGKPNEFGSGAWQVGMRYNYLNLNDKGINGGILNDITLGLNWFINPNMKLQWNYSMTYRDSPGGESSGWIQGFGMRYAMDY